MGPQARGAVGRGVGSDGWGLWDVWTDDAVYGADAECEVGDEGHSSGMGDWKVV